MNKIHLDHGRAKRLHSFIGNLLLTLGLITILLLVAAVYYVSSRMSLIEADISSQRQLKPADLPRVPALNDEETQAAQRVMAELSLPWESLLSALESIDQDGVKLLSVEPDARKGRLRIAAEASDTGEILAYVQALNDQAMLDDAFMQQQERKDSGMYVFTIEARWNTSS